MDGTSTQPPTDRRGLWAMLGVLATSALLLAVAGAELPPTGLRPPPPAASRGPLGALADLLGLSDLGGGAKGVLAVVCACLAATAFLYALVQAWHGRLPQRWAVGMGVGLFVAVLATPLLFSRDAYNYGLYGRIVSAYGQNPYTTVPADVPNDPFMPLTGPKWVNDPSVYGPAFTMLSAGVTSLLDSVGSVVFAFKLLASAAGIGTILLIRSAARSLAPTKVTFAIVVFAWNPIVVFNTIGGAHNDMAVALAVAGALALLCARRPNWAVAVLTLGALVKASAGIPLVLVLVWLIASSPAGTRARATVRPLAISLGMSLLFAAPFLQMENPSLGLVAVAGHSGGFALSAFVERVAVEVVPASLAVSARWVIHVAFLAAFLVVFCAIAVRIARTAARPEGGSLRELGAAWGWALLLFIVATPFWLPWYLVWVLPVAYLLPRSGRRVLLVLVVAGMLFQVVGEHAWLLDILVVRDWLIRSFVVGGVGVAIVVALWRRLRGDVPLADEPDGVPGDGRDHDRQDAASPMEP